MKGMEFKMLLGLIFVVIILLIIMIIVVNPVILFGEGAGTQIDFRQFCLHWSVEDYHYYGATDAVYIEGEAISIKEACEAALGIENVQTSQEIENCRNLCRART